MVILSLQKHARCCSAAIPNVGMCAYDGKKKQNSRGQPSSGQKCKPFPHFRTDPSKRTLPVGLINLQQAARGAANYGRLYAGLVIVMIPTLIIYILVQKQLTEGMMVGGDKG